VPSPGGIRRDRSGGSVAGGGHRTQFGRARHAPRPPRCCDQGEGKRMACPPPDLLKHIDQPGGGLAVASMRIAEDAERPSGSRSLKKYAPKLVHGIAVRVRHGHPRRNGISSIGIRPAEPARRRRTTRTFAGDGGSVPSERRRLDALKGMGQVSRNLLAHQQRDLPSAAADEDAWGAIVANDGRACAGSGDDRDMESSGNWRRRRWNSVP